MKKAFEATLVREGSRCFIPLPFDPKEAFGKVRAPVRVSIGGHVYRSTIAWRGNGPCVPLRRSHREAARLEGDETLRVVLELDTAPRVVTPPADLARALRATPGAREAWEAWSPSHRRARVDAIERAKKPETRTRRIEAAVRDALAVRAVPSVRARVARTTDEGPRAAKRTAKSEANQAKRDARPRLNAAWHEGHRMPKNPTLEQRLAWHEAHAAHCACRPMSPQLAAMVAARAGARTSK